MENNYTYPAVLNYSEEGFINIRIPAFDIVTCVETGEDPIIAAQDALTLEILAYEESGEELPSNEFDGNAEEGENVVYINIWMPYHRSKVKEVYVKKTLTIPAWMDQLAKNENINFSSTLVEALKSKLGL